MIHIPRWLLAITAIIASTGAASAQVGVISGPANSLFSCTASVPNPTQLRPEGYTELLGDVLITCTGGPLIPTGALIPTTTTVILYVLPETPITSRIIGNWENGLSEAMLIIDEAGSNLVATGATGGYGPQAPESLCTPLQQGGADGGCAAYIGLDTSGQYEVAVVPGTSTPAQNVYQGTVGDFGSNSVAFYNVPVLPPGYSGVSRTFRITNIRVAASFPSQTQISVLISTSPYLVLPVAATPITAATVGPAMTAAAIVSPGVVPFGTCMPQITPALASKIFFSESFPGALKTRVVPGGASTTSGNTTWAAEAQNLVSPSNQNVPGGLYNGFNLTNESGFIFPAATFTDPTSNIAYTAGLADFGTRLKAVFSNIPAGVTVYVSTTSTDGNVAIPGGTSTAPFAVLVAGSRDNDGTGDGTTFAPLTSTAVGSDGFFAYPLVPDDTGVAAAIWEVVNASTEAVETAVFSVYMAYSSTLGTVSPTNVALSYAPEPGGGSFSSVDGPPGIGGLTGLSSPVPRFGVLTSQGGGFGITSCELSANTSAVPFSYSIGGANPPTQTASVNLSPSNLPVTVTPVVTTPSGGNWLSASLSPTLGGGGFPVQNTYTLTISVNPSALTASSTAYGGTVQLSASGVSNVLIPVTLTVSSPPAQLSILKSHSGNFAAGQLGATYMIAVSNGASAGPTSGPVTVTENPPSGMSVVSMSSAGNVWTCTTSACTTSNSISGGASYPPITVTVNVASNASSPLINQASVSGGGSSASPSYSDPTSITPLTCTVTGDQTPSFADAQQIINQALGTVPATYDLNSDGVITVADVQIAINAASGRGCQ